MVTMFGTDCELDELLLELLELEEDEELLLLELLLELLGLNAEEELLEDELLELGYYVAPLKLQPFGKFELQKFSAASTPSKDVTRYGVGLNYYVAGQNLKFTGQALRVKPKNNSINTTNEFTIQMQMWYY